MSYTDDLRQLKKSAVEEDLPVEVIVMHEIAVQLEAIGQKLNHVEDAVVSIREAVEK